MGKTHVDCKLAHGYEHGSNFNGPLQHEIRTVCVSVRQLAINMHFTQRSNIEIRNVFVSVCQLAINTHFTQRRTMHPDKQLSLVCRTGNEPTIESNSPPIKSVTCTAVSSAVCQSSLKTGDRILNLFRICRCTRSTAFRYPITEIQSSTATSCFGEYGECFPTPCHPPGPYRQVLPREYPESAAQPFYSS